MKDNKFSIIELEWETNFYGISSAKVLLNSQLTEKEIMEVKDLVSKYKFITFVNINNNPVNNRLLASIGAFYTDINLELEKKLSIDKLTQQELPVKASQPKVDGLVELAENAFSLSRFYNVKELYPKNRQVYAEWVKNSFNRKDKIICYYKEKQHCAFLINSLSNGYSVSELLAVDPALAGKGIASKLLNSVEKYLLDNNIELLKAGTQVNNIQSLMFHIRRGFVFTKTYSYHTIIKDLV